MDFITIQKNACLHQLAIIGFKIKKKDYVSSMQPADYETVEKNVLIK